MFNVQSIVVYLPRLDHGSKCRKYTIHLVLVLFLVCFDFWQFPLIEDMSRVDRCFHGPYIQTFQEPVQDAAA